MLRSLLLSLVILGFAITTFGQQTVKNPYPNDIRKQRLLAISAGTFLYAVLQGQLDMDSTMLLACKGYGFSRLLPYDEGYHDGAETPGARLIDAGKINEATLLANRLKGADQLTLLVELGSYYLFKPGTDKADLDHALAFIEKARQLSNAAQLRKWQDESLTLLAIYHYQNRNLAESQKYFSLVTQSCKNRKDDLGLARALCNQGFYLPFRHPQKLPLLEESLALYRKLGQKEKEIELLAAVLTEHFMTDWASAEKELIENIELQKKIGFRHHHFALHSLSYIASTRSDYIKEYHYANQAMKSVQATGDYAYATIFYQGLGMAYRHMGKVKEALNWYSRGTALPKTRENKIFWYKSFIAEIPFQFEAGLLKEVLRDMEKVIAEFPPESTLDVLYMAFYRGLCYERLKQPARAEAFYNQVDTLASKFPAAHAHGDVPHMYMVISDFYLTQGNKAKARLYLEKSEASSLGRVNTIQLASISRMRFRLDSANGNYFSAFKNFRQFKIYEDSLMAASSMRQINQLMAQYETVKKDQNIKLLTQKSELQQSKLLQAESQRNMTLGGIGLLVVIVGLVYNQYRAKRKSNDLLLEQQREISRKNEALEELVTEKDDLLQEKEWLLKEVHHRVKNNLHTVMSLLESQSSYLENDALNAIRDSQHRVQAMSLIHQKLYLSENVTTIDMSIYMRELVTYLRNSFQTKQRIYFNLLLEPIELDIAQAIPLGLILNEAITNALKYAFPDNRDGEIIISIAKSEEYEFLLTVSDNGIGMPENFDINQSASLGMKLMRGLCQEINGQFKIVSDGGTSISISFVIERMFRKLQESRS